jgi:hypothetical protein
MFARFDDRVGSGRHGVPFVFILGANLSITFANRKWRRRANPPC